VQYYRIHSIILFRRCTDCATATCTACEIGEVCQVQRVASCQECAVNCVKVLETVTATVSATTISIPTTSGSSSLGTGINDGIPSTAKPASNHNSGYTADSWYNSCSRHWRSAWDSWICLLEPTQKIRSNDRDKRSIPSKVSDSYIPTGGRHELDINQRAEVFEILGSEENIHELDGESLPVKMG
jgi:hypothetical protein